MILRALQLSWRVYVRVLLQSERFLSNDSETLSKYWTPRGVRYSQKSSLFLFLTG
jgi:hypothetical protein